MVKIGILYSIIIPNATTIVKNIDIGVAGKPNSFSRSILSEYLFLIFQH